MPVVAWKDYSLTRMLERAEEMERFLTPTADKDKTPNALSCNALHEPSPGTRTPAGTRTFPGTRAAAAAGTSSVTRTFPTSPVMRTAAAAGTSSLAGTLSVARMSPAAGTSSLANTPSGASSSAAAGTSSVARMQPTFELTIEEIVEGPLEVLEKDARSVFPPAMLEKRVQCINGTEDDPAPRLHLAQFGVGLGKWTGKDAVKWATRTIKEALDFKNSGECDGSACLHNQTGKHMLCNMDIKVIETVHPYSKLVSHFI